MKIQTYTLSGLAIFVNNLYRDSLGYLCLINKKDPVKEAWGMDIDSLLRIKDREK